MSDYSQLLIYQYARKPKARATIDSVLGEYDKLSDNAIDLLNQWDIDQARGFSLDIIGRRIGVSRTLPAAIAKGYFGYLNSIDGEPWGQGVWYRAGESTGDTLVLNDQDYRFLIRAKIFKNFQNGTFDYILNAFRIIISPDSNIEDNLDMTAKVYIPIASLTLLQRYMVEKMDILPRPMGVLYTYLNGSIRAFGFDGFFNSYGFDEGRFLDA